MRQVKPTKFKSYMEAHGNVQTYREGDIFHTHDLKQKLFLVKSGYVKRYQAQALDQKVLELIYGPDHIVSLSQLYKMLFGVSQNQENLLYVYQAMTDVEMCSIDAETVFQELKRNPGMHEDFFYESGLKLRSNISRLASNSLKDDDKKVAHQLMSLAYEFAGITPNDARNQIELPLPQTALDLAEQLNIPKKAVEDVLARFIKTNIIAIDSTTITILNIEFLKDIYV